jgi:hypothetical protein
MLKIFRNRLLVGKRHFSKNPKPEEGQIVKKVHINETKAKFSKIMSWEIIPVFFIFSGAVIYFKF